MNIEPIQKLTSKVREKELHLFELENVREYRTWSGDPSAVIRKTEIDPLKITYWLSEKADVEVAVKDSNDLVLLASELLAAGETRRGFRLLELAPL